MFQHKVFGIGFHKTGTKSLAHALRKLGYRVTGPNGMQDCSIAKTAWPMAKTRIPEYDAFQDNPWPVLFKEIDAHVADCKFILTLRDDADWFQSALNHFGSSRTPMRAWIYGHGSPLGNENMYRARFKQHNSEVLAYFKDRPDDLLVMDILGGDGWGKLCPFLGVDMIEENFPHRNSRAKL